MKHNSVKKLISRPAQTGVVIARINVLINTLVMFNFVIVRRSDFVHEVISSLAIRPFGGFVVGKCYA